MAEGKDSVTDKEETRNEGVETPKQASLLDESEDQSSEIEEEYLDEEEFERRRTEAVERRRRMMEEKEEEEEEDEEEPVLSPAEEFDFPKDPEGWTEEDLQELWTDAPTEITNDIGWDPDLADEDDWELIDSLRSEGKTMDLQPFYVPYRKYYPVIPDNHHDIENPKAAVEELERIEEFLKWVSYVFPDGSTYEGTVWDDLAQGKGVYTTPMELCRYEGEWLQNSMQGHGVLEVNVPEVEPPPDSELASKMRAQGKILKTDYLSPDDKEWLKMDIEDTEQRYNYSHPVALEDSDIWIKYFGQKPEKGLYRYAGQWKHSRMHGCGVYEVNRRQIWGKFYFGELMANHGECTDKISAMHAGLAEVAAAKARMFVNKPDGMVREMKGPYNDPQHPYMYEEEDLWMAPGFINAFYKVPKLWKRYVHDVDQEREMWLNSFYKSPLRIPMPAELEYWWSKDPEFMRIGSTEDPEDELLLHVPSGKLINWAEDKEGRVRLFWQPLRLDGEVNPEEAVFLPLGFDEFMGKTKAEHTEKETEEERLKRVWAEEDQRRKEKWRQEDEERRKRWEEERKQVELELKYIEAEEKLEDILEDIEYELKIKQINEEAMERKNREKEPKDTSGPEESEGGPSQDDEEAEEEDDDADKKPRSFGTVALCESQQQHTNSDTKNNTNGRPCSSATPTLFASLSMFPLVAWQQLNPLASWQTNKKCASLKVNSPELANFSAGIENTMESASTAIKYYARFPVSRNKVARLKAVKIHTNLDCKNSKSSLQFKGLVSLARILSTSYLDPCKQKKSYGMKKSEENQRTKQKVTMKIYSNKLRTMPNEGIFSLSLPMEHPCR